MLTAMRPRRNNAKVLVVDDHPDLCRVMVRLIEMSGYSAVWATDGADALAMVQASPPAMIFLDVMMPGLNGFDVLKELRSHEEHGGVAVVMCSALGDAESRRRAFALGAQEYLVKSHIDYDVLKTVVERYARPIGGETFGGGASADAV